MRNDFKEYSAAFYATNNDILHYGVLGMKWGVRRAKAYNGNYEDAGKMQRHLRKNARNEQINTRAMEIAKKKMGKSKVGSKKYKKWEKHYNEASASRRYAQGEINKIKKGAAGKGKVSVSSERRSGRFLTPGEAFAWGGNYGPWSLNSAYLNKHGAIRDYQKYKVRKVKKKK